MHDLLKQWPHNCISHFDRGQRSSLAAPMLIRDGMDAVQSMVSGQWYESKSQMRAEYKREGVVEIGNEKMKPREIDAGPPISEIENTVAAAYNQLDP